MAKKYFRATHEFDLELTKDLEHALRILSRVGDDDFEKYDEGECLFPSQGRGRQFMILKAEQIIERTGRNFPSE
jgi:hypothetical protein